MDVGAGGKDKDESYELQGTGAGIRAAERGEGDLVFGVDTPQPTRKGDRTCEPPARGPSSDAGVNVPF